MVDKIWVSVQIWEPITQGGDRDKNPTNMMRIVERKIYPKGEYDQNGEKSRPRSVRDGMGFSRRVMRVRSMSITQLLLMLIGEHLTTRAETTLLRMDSTIIPA